MQCGAGEIAWMADMRNALKTEGAVDPIRRVRPTRYAFDENYGKRSMA